MNVRARRFVGIAVGIAMFGLATPPSVRADADYTIPAGTNTLSTVTAKLRVGVGGQTGNVIDVVTFTGCAPGDTRVSRGEATGVPSGSSVVGTATATVTALCLKTTQPYDVGAGGPDYLFVTLQSARSVVEEATFGPGLESLGLMKILFAPGGLGGTFESTLNVNYDVRKGSATGSIVVPGLSTGSFSTATAGAPPTWARGSVAVEPDPLCHENPGGAHLHCVVAVYLGTDPFVPGGQGGGGEEVGGVVGETTESLADSSSTVEWDPGCILDPVPTPFVPTGSPGTSPCEVTRYDGSTEVTDLSTTGNRFGARNGTITATFKVDGAIPWVGNTYLPGPDQAAPNYVGGTYYALFQNRTTQTNVPTNPRGGCARVGTGTPVYDQQDSWKDGYHKFLYFHFGWDGTKWTRSIGVGTYDPSPDGGLRTQEIAVANNDGDGDGNGNDWDAVDPNGPSYAVNTLGAASGTVSVSVDGIVKETDMANCQEGFMRTVYAGAGDIIGNVKFLTTSDAVVQLPVTIPLSATCGPTGGMVCHRDITSIGGFVFWTDQTAGASTAGLLGCNPVGTSFTRGCQGTATGLVPNVDTLGDGLTCPTPTIGGALPSNPLFTPDTACHIDDDSIYRGAVLAELWETTVGVIA